MQKSLHLSRGCGGVRQAVGQGAQGRTPTCESVGATRVPRLRPELCPWGSRLSPQNLLGGSVQHNLSTGLKKPLGLTH